MNAVGLTSYILNYNEIIVKDTNRKTITQRLSCCLNDSV